LLEEACGEQVNDMLRLLGEIRSVTNRQMNTEWQ